MSDINIGLLAENQNLSKFEITENFSCVRFLDQNKDDLNLNLTLKKELLLILFSLEVMRNFLLFIHLRNNI